MRLVVALLILVASTAYAGDVVSVVKATQKPSKFLGSGLSPGVVKSPDGKHQLKIKEAPTGLDVQTFSVEFKGRKLAGEALDAHFSPDSRYIFIATGPHPIVWNVKSGSKTAITKILSGLENYPVVVTSWSKDGKTLVLYQQKRFDDSSEPVKWTVKLR